MAVAGEQEAFPNAVQAANITCSGILSHQSALDGGEKIYLPEWTLSDQKPFEVALVEGGEPAWEGETALV
jgi:hypothetical protein